MTIFYRGPGVRITHEVMEVWHPVHRRFAIRELRRVCVIAQPATPAAGLAAVRNGSSGMAGAVALVGALAWAEGWPALAAPVPALAVALLLVVSVAVAGACWLVRPVQRELAAVHRGELVSLYRSTEQRTFDQVRRALIRALEHATDMR